jgi:hypothetical protein
LDDGAEKVALVELAPAPRIVGAFKVYRDISFIEVNTSSRHHSHKRKTAKCRVNGGGLSSYSELAVGYCCCDPPLPETRSISEDEKNTELKVHPPQKSNASPKAREIMTGRDWRQAERKELSSRTVVA